MDQYIRIGLCGALALLNLALALFSCHKRAKAKTKGDEASAVWYETFERIYTMLLCVTFAVLLLTCHQQTMITGFVEILARLEALSNGQIL